MIIPEKLKKGDKIRIIAPARSLGIINEETITALANAIYKKIRSKRELSEIPIVYQIDFGHTTPHITFPIGGEVQLSADEEIIIKMH